MAFAKGYENAAANESEEPAEDNRAEVPAEKPEEAASDEWNWGL